MKKITLTLSLLACVGLGGYIAYQEFYQNPAKVAPIAITSSEASPPQTSPIVSSTPQTASGYKDGQYTGAVADAFYGPVQVKVTIKNHVITDIKFLQYPNTPGHTTEVSNQAMPLLVAEAIKAQSANVDIVSGATQTTQGFIQSLSSALSKAI